MVFKAGISQSRRRSYSASIAVTALSMVSGFFRAHAHAYWTKEVGCVAEWLCSFTIARVHSSLAIVYPMRQPVIANVFEKLPPTQTNCLNSFGNVVEVKISPGG